MTLGKGEGRLSTVFLLVVLPYFAWLGVVFL